MGSDRRLIWSTASAVCIGLVLQEPAAAVAAGTVGVTTATNPVATGTPPSGSMRTLRVGVDMFFKEQVDTGPTGQTQLLFLDGSTLTVGPNSSLRLDEFVYDPNASTGKLTLSAIRGVFRFVGGKLSKSGDVTVMTPAAGLGIRGGVALISIDQYSVTQATLVFGKSLAITGAGGTSQVITRPGFSSTIAPGAAPTEPEPVTSTTLAQLGQLEGRAGATGGVVTPPTDQQVAAAPLGPVLHQVTTTRQERATTQQVSTSVAASVAFSPINNAVSNVTPARAQMAAELALASSRGVPTPVPSTPTSPSTPNITPTPPQTPPAQNSQQITPAQFGALSIINDPTLNSPVPFLISQNVPVGNLRTTPFMVVITNGTYEAASLTPGALNGGYVAALGIQGTGRNQTSHVLAGTGQITTQASPTTNDRPGYLAGRFVASTKFGPVNSIVTSGAFTSTTPSSGESPFRGGVAPQNVEITSDATSYGTTVASPITTSKVVNGQLQPVSYTFDNRAVQAALPAGVGSSRTTQTLSGYAVGLNGSLRPDPAPLNPDLLTYNSPALYFVGSALTDPASVQIKTDASTSRVAATLNLAPVDMPSGSTILASYGTVSTDPGTANQRVSFVDDSHFAAQTSLQTAPSSNPAVVTSASNSRVNGQIPTNTDGSFIVTSGGIEPSNLLPTGTSFCRCQYLQWGFFQSNYRTNSGNQTDRINLGTWAAGPLASPTDMPTTGSATYSGHAIGTAYTFNTPNAANSGSANYVAAGGFTNQWNFATRSGNLAITNFDGATYTGTASAANRRDYAGTLTGAGRSVAVGGSFFKGGGDPARETGGQFRITGPGYQAGGIFAGAK